MDKFFTAFGLGASVLNILMVRLFDGQHDVNHQTIKLQ